eukprot:scpid49842/ scgid15435/ Cyclic AMP-responsive element-binding protein 3-like protein 1; Old astrocyte specifically-induced substance; Processed cyclic AMP-responsive element-binding protein 3-like protein 1
MDSGNSLTPLAAVASGTGSTLVDHDHDYCGMKPVIQPQATQVDLLAKSDFLDFFQANLDGDHGDTDELLGVLNWSQEFDSYLNGPSLFPLENDLELLLNGFEVNALNSTRSAGSEELEDDGYKSHGSAGSPAVDSPLQPSHVIETCPPPVHNDSVSDQFPLLSASSGSSLQGKDQRDAAELALLNACLEGDSFSRPCSAGQGTSVLVNGKDLSSSATTSPGREGDNPVASAGQSVMGSTSRVPKHCAEREDKRLSGPTAFISNAVCWQYGKLKLTPEEISVLKSEGLPIPTTLPLAPEEEKAIKHVRRKIKNKISAQESRRKRKEYIGTLEKQLAVCTDFNKQLMERVATLEKQNSSLYRETTELRKQFTVPEPLLQSPSRLMKAPSSTSHIPVLLFAVVFALAIPLWTTHNLPLPWEANHLMLAVADTSSSNNNFNNNNNHMASVSDYRLHSAEKALAAGLDPLTEQDTSSYAAVSSSPAEQFDYGPVKFHSRTLLHYVDESSSSARECCTETNRTTATQLETSTDPVHGIGKLARDSEYVSITHHLNITSYSLSLLNTSAGGGIVSDHAVLVSTSHAQLNHSVKHLNLVL